MGRMSEAPVRPGDVLAGKYRVERVLGAGAMGVVVAAIHVELGQRVALKFLRSGKAEGHEQRERFLREARAAGRLKSQHVARVLDMGTLEDGAPYIVMELLEGQDLSAVLKARGPLPFDEAVMYMLQTCEAVGEAHAAGIVHRDLKPANLFCAEDIGGAVSIKVLDFGVSKLSGMDLSLTHESEILGSPLYMSPEQMSSSKSVDGRSDVWALGVVLYQLIAGRTPYHGESMAQLVANVLVGQPAPLGAYRGDAPPGFEAVLLRCLQRDREHRFADVAAFAAALAPYAPEHARGYAGRVARAMGKKGGPSASVPELPAPSRGIEPAPRGIEPAPAPAGELQTSQSVTRPLGRTPLASSIGSATALSISSKQSASQAGAAAVTARLGGSGISPRAVLRASFVLVAVLGIGGVVMGLWLAQRGAPEPPEAAAPAADSAAASVPTSGSAAASVSAAASASATASVPASASVAEGAPGGRDGSRRAPIEGGEVKPVPSATAKATAKPSLPQAPSIPTARPVATAKPAAPPARPAEAPALPKKREGIL
jgi:eukaryotic-like serine/threonine-protein kinase